MNTHHHTEHEAYRRINRRRSLLCIHEDNTGCLPVQGWIALLLIILFLSHPVAAIKDQTPYCPTKEELTALFHWGGPLYWADKDGDPYTYTCEADDYTQSNENGRAYQGFRSESYADRIVPGASPQKNAVKTEQIQENVEIIEYVEPQYTGVTAEEWRQPEADVPNGKVVFHDVSGIGDNAYAISRYWEYKEMNRDVFNTKFMRLCFVKGNYYVQVTLDGADENLIGTMGKGGESYDNTILPYPSENSVPTLDKLMTVARIIEKKLPCKEKKTCPMGGVRPSESCS